MKVARIIRILGLACFVMLYMRSFWPTQLDPGFIIYGQSAGSAPCTACPFMSVITPPHVNAGESQQVVISGMNLNVGNPAITLNGNDVTAVVNASVSTAIDATIIAAAQATLGARTITVSSNYGSSGAFCCVLVKSSTPGPTLDSISPTSANAGSSNTTITLTGSGFDAGSVVRINGTDIPTTFVNGSDLQAEIPASVLSTTGLLGVTVTNSGPSTSDFKVFTVLSTSRPFFLGLVPRGLEPNTTMSGFLTGGNLLGATSVQWTGQGISVAIQPGGTPTAIPVTITVGDAPLGPRLGNVTTPAGTSIAFMTQFVVAPRVGKWTLVEPLISFRSDHTSTLLPDGRVLASGGGSIFAEIYNPAAGTWTLTSGMNSTRSQHSATLLANGKVLVAAGSDNSCCPGQALASAE